MRQQWEQFLLLQETLIGKTSVDRWLRPLRLHSFDARCIHIIAEDLFLLNWFEEQMRSQVEEYFTKVHHKSIRIETALATEEQEGAQAPIKQSNKHPLPSIASSLPLSDACDLLCTFHAFYYSPDHAIVQRVLEELCVEVQSGATTTALPNPIYLYGPHGSGKTHLLMAIASLLQRQGRRIVYARSETFIEQAVQAMRAGEMRAFRQLYRSSDLLLLDDIHLFARKAVTQEELFHTFNTLHIANKPIIFSSLYTPQELEHIEPRLMSRFAWGIALPVHPVSSKELIEVLRKKSEALRLTLSKELQAFLLQKFARNAGTLCKALEALALRVDLRKERIQPKKPFSLTRAEELLHDLLEAEEKRLLRPEQILEQVAHHYGILVEDLTGRRQTRESALPRQMAMYLCRNALQLSLKKIGDLFGRHHTTVLSSVENIQQRLLQNDPSLTSDHVTLRKALSS